jgi:hypothetical protein
VRRRRAARAGVVTVFSETPGAIKFALVDSGHVPDPVLAAGELRQGEATSTAAAMVGLVRPRPSKLLPRHFVLAVTAEEVIVFGATGGSTEGGGAYALRIAEVVAARFPRSEVRIAGLTAGKDSKGGILHAGDEAIPVVRALLNGEQNTDELFAVLGADG